MTAVVSRVAASVIVAADVIAGRESSFELVDRLWCLWEMVSLFGSAHEVVLTASIREWLHKV